jgi:dTDP-4-amino-4,6-dideoxygalactose transaminase
LLGHGIGPGDEVITSAFTFIASANSILYTGARPVFADIDPRTFNLDPECVEAAITPRTRAILPVHLFGLTCDMPALQAIAEKHNLVIIEDACQSHGAAYRGQKAGSFGTGVFSLYPTKNMTSAEGGMITTNDPDLAEHCRVIRSHGMRVRYYHDELGFNFRMTDLHAAVGLAQLGKLEDFNRKRRDNAAYFNLHIKGVQTPYVPEGCEHVYHQYTLLVPDGKRDALRAFLLERGIGSEVYYPVPIHQQKYYRETLGYQVSLPVTEATALGVLSIPVHPALSLADRDSIVGAIAEFFVGLP